MDEPTLPAEETQQDGFQISASDIMNDHEFDPPPPRDTVTSKPGSEAGLGFDTCRICRSEGTPEEPLFYPCKCSGSIKFVHQECLMEWLSHSHKKHCELCKTPFRFTKLYDADMPTTLPWAVFVRRAAVHSALMFIHCCRALLVSTVWLVAMPWLIRWTWRWMFWFADAGWAREDFMRKTQALMRQAHGEAAAAQAQSVISRIFSYLLTKIKEQLQWGHRVVDPNIVASGKAVGTVASVLSHLGFDVALANATSIAASLNSTRIGPLANSWPQTDPSILSSWTYIAELTPHPHVNRIILDIFEGQLITCVVITGFILIFLIREWVVQQQPLVNLDNLNNEQRERERQERNRERARREAQRLEQEMARPAVVHNEAVSNVATRSEVSVSKSDKFDFEGWDFLNDLIDDATVLLRVGDEEARENFALRAESVIRQAEVTEHKDFDASKVANKIFEKLATYPEEERVEWQKVIVSELKKISREKKDFTLSEADPDRVHFEDSKGVRRPPMPNRESSSRAAQIQRLLEEKNTEAAKREPQASRNLRLSTGGTQSPDSSESAISAASTDGSWQLLGLHESNVAHEHDPTNSLDVMVPENEELPITNAGPDAKINIKRSSRGNARVVPQSKSSPGLLSDTDQEPESNESDVNGSQKVETLEHGVVENVAAQQPDDPVAQSNSPQHQDFPDTRHQEENTLRDSVTNVLREEFGLDDADEAPRPQPPDQGLVPEIGQNADESAEPLPHQRQDAGSIGTFGRLADWFWGDIEPQENTSELGFAPNEERLEAGDDAPITPAAPAVPAGDDPHAVPVVPLEELMRLDNDPEMVAAAQEAGLNAEALEDAEDLEGVFELIGLHGPLIGLFQTSSFCSVLVTGTVFGAVGLPYVWGKLVLSFIGSPTNFLFKMPLQIASFLADVVIDIALLIGGWFAVVGAVALDFLFSALEAWMPTLASHNIIARFSDMATSTAVMAGSRLHDLLLILEPVNGMGWDSAFLAASVHAHASLKTLEEEVQFLLDYTGGMVTAFVNMISSPSAPAFWEICINAFERLGELPGGLMASIDTIGQDYMQRLVNLTQNLRSGSLTFTTVDTPPDPSLVYWSSNDRALAVLAGYAALAAIAAIYVAVDSPITRSPAGQKTEKMVRDTLRQAGGVLKVILIISIEMLVFPLYCGLLLDLAFLPLFQGASIATRWAFAVRAPCTFCFVHWFVGTCYMFHFALFVGMCRKILRKGVLWFIRDPDDPTFHPVRDVLERNITTQLRKIAFSGLVYGALVILCLGGVIWFIGRAFKGIFPIHWIPTEPILEFPIDLLLYNILTPFVIRLFKPSDAVHATYAWWLRHCAKTLRLSHFLFHDRRKEEEGTFVRKSWTSFLLMKKVSLDEASDSPPSNSILDDQADVYFKRDGKYVLTPCNDQYRPPKPGEAFLQVDNDDIYVVDKEGKKNENFAKVYIPPMFRLRVTLFMVCLWMFSAFTGLCTTLLPLVFGRRVLTAVLPLGAPLNDIYAYSVGAYVLGAALFVLLNGHAAARRVREKARSVELKAWATSAANILLKALKCFYVYGFFGVMLPLSVALLLQFYFILPLRTYLASTTSTSGALRPENGTAFSFTNFNYKNGSFIQYAAGADLTTDYTQAFSSHTIHVLADYALGLLYLRILMRSILTTPSSRAVEAFRRITADGLLNPNVRLATRFFVLPAILVSILALLAPPAAVKAAFSSADLIGHKINLPIEIDSIARTALYRYSYPLAAGWVLIALVSHEVTKMTARWRARIKDEVYLVGERLHNFGEGKPPAGSKTVLRKER